MPEEHNVTSCIKAGEYCLSERPGRFICSGLSCYNPSTNDLYPSLIVHLNS